MFLAYLERAMRTGLATVADLGSVAAWRRRMLSVPSGARHTSVTVHHARALRTVLLPLPLPLQLVCARTAAASRSCIPLVAPTQHAEYVAPSKFRSGHHHPCACARARTSEDAKGP